MEPILKVLTPNPNYVFTARQVSDLNSDELVVKESWVENVYDVHDGDFHDNKIAIDLGANIGAWSLFAASLDPEVKVFAYEPQDDNHHLLVTNVRDNRCNGQVNVLKRAVGREAGFTYMTNAMGNSQMTSTEKGGGERVPVDTLEQVFTDNHIDECAVMKVDVEGAEYDIFALDAVSTETLMRIKYLTMEFTENDAESFGKLVASLSRAFNLHIIGQYNRGGYIYGRRY